MIIYVLLSISLAWSLLLSLLLLRIVRRYRRLFGKGTVGIDKVLDKILDGDNQRDRQIKLVLAQIEKLEKKTDNCLSSSGLVKFNPFSDLGGSQSFSLALLNRLGLGVIISGLHGRQTTRVYAKLLGQEGKLSAEEELAIKKAKQK
ncbi:MAG: DUF4446 family protein [Patescibacteria group bacterium]